MKLNKNRQTINSLTDVIVRLTDNNKNAHTSSFFWGSVADSVQRDLLFKVAEELNLPSPRLINSKDLITHKFLFINNLPFNGFYSYYKKMPGRKKGEHLITQICNKLSIPEVSTDDWIKYIRNNNIHSWNGIPNEVKKQILYIASEELGYDHPIYMNNDDFSKKYDFLGGKSLTGFYSYFNKMSYGIRGSAIISMCDSLGIEITQDDWIKYITDSNINTFWNVIPVEIIQNILYKASKKLGCSNPRMLSTEDLKIPVVFLNNMSLYSFASRFFGVERSGSRNIDYICDLYSIPELSFEQWLELIRKSNNFKWELLPKKYTARILTLKAHEEGYENPRMLKAEDLNKPCLFINNKNLSGLYNYYSHIKTCNDDTYEYMCNESCIPQLNFDQWISFISEQDSKTSWAIVPVYIKRKILFCAAKELNLKNPRLIDYQTLCNTHFRFLSGKTLSGLHSYYINKYFKNTKDEMVLQKIYDILKIEKPSLSDWIENLAGLNIIKWEVIPMRVQKEVIIRAAHELRLKHPRFMKTSDFNSVEYIFINYKTLSGLYNHYASKFSGNPLPVTECIFDYLNISKYDINPKTGRIYTIKNNEHKKYFDSKANLKSFIDDYLKYFDLESLCHKYTMINNAKKAGIYKKGLITVISPLNTKKYIDLIYELIKNVPRDCFNFKKVRNSDYRIYKQDLYKIAGIKYDPDNIEKISFAKTENKKIRNKSNIIKKLKTYIELINIKIRKFHNIGCKYLTFYNGMFIYYANVYIIPGETLMDNSNFEYEVIECREKKSNDGYVLELRPLDETDESKASKINTLTKDSNDSLLLSYLNDLILSINNNTVSNTVAIILGLKNENTLKNDNIYSLPVDKYNDSELVKNIAQKQAVDLSLTLDGNNNAVEIIQGPPGTGKTTVIREIALQYYSMGKNVLILAKSNIAVDNVLEKLIPDNVRVLRTGNNIEKKSSLNAAYVLSTSNSLYLNSLGDSNKIVLGTPFGFYLDKKINAADYDIVIIDEASQMDVPETLFSIRLAKRAVIIGDHFQIPPYPIQNEVFNEYDPKMSMSTKEDLQQSLFEKLITDKDRFNSIFLDINYRTKNPLLVSFISDLIYDGNLSANPNSEYYKIPKSKRKKLFPEDAIEIIDTSKITDETTRMESEFNSTYFNITEALLSVKKVLDLKNAGESLRDICIITPYKAHAEKLKEVFNNKINYFGDDKKSIIHFITHNIYTIDSFQGREQQNVIVNWVRSNFEFPDIPTKTGFLKDFRRINVALSRAKKRLILIGDFDTLTNSENLTVKYIFSKIKNFNNENRIVL